jgi:hypothetical protein
MLAAAAVMGATSCGGKEDTEETVDTIKRKLVGTWVNPAFSFLPGEAPSTFTTTTCDTITSPKFEPFNYTMKFNMSTMKNDTIASLNTNSLFVPLLTSVTFTDNNIPDHITATFEFERCDTNFSENLKIDDTKGFLGGIKLHKLNDTELKLFDGITFLHLSH